MRPCLQMVSMLTLAVALTQSAVNETEAAQNPICRQILAQLRQVEQAPSSRSLKREHARSTAEADRRGCFGGFFLRRSGKRCAPLLKRIERIERLLQRPARTAQTAASLRRELERNGCFDTRPAGPRSARQAPKEPAPEPRASAFVRTVCVRKCDGYFFPLGMSTKKALLDRDAETCRTIYGPAGSDLYLYPLDGRPEDMVSVDGSAYAQQDFAFGYRREYRASCQAELKEGLARIESAAIARAKSKMIPIPVPRPSEPALVAAAPAETEPKAVSRIIAEFPLYLAAPTSSSRRLADEPSRTREKKPIDFVDTLFEQLIPPAEASDSLPQ